MRIKWIGLAVIAAMWMAGKAGASTTSPVVPDTQTPYRYHLTFHADDRRRVDVEAAVTLKRGRLMMAPWGYATSLEHGWANFVENLQVSHDGKPVAAKALPGGEWQVDAPDDSMLDLRYTVRLTHDQVDWKSAGGVDARPALQTDTATWITKALIIFSDDDNAAVSIGFDLPPGWTAATPWREATGQANHWRPDDLYQAYDNAIVVGKVQQRQIIDGSMRVTLVMAPEIADSLPRFEQALAKDLAEYRRLFGATPDAHYLIALRQDVVDDGEAFGSSFVQVFKDSDLASRTLIWSRLFAHELFHYWNGGRLGSSDVAGTEWFKEGFTDYIASRTVVRNGQITPREWEQMLGIFMGRFFSSRFMQPGDKPSLRDAGQNKIANWRLIYGGGATIALLMDIQLRHDTDNRRSLDDVLRLLDQRYGAIGKPFTPEQLRATFDEVGGRDYSRFFADYVDGRGALPPIADILAKAGWHVNHVVDEYYLSALPRPDAKAVAIHNALLGVETAR